jgi:hypothetical protein
VLCYTTYYLNNEQIPFRFGDTHKFLRIPLHDDDEVPFLIYGESADQVDISDKASITIVSDTIEAVYVS